MSINSGETRISHGREFSSRASNYALPHDSKEYERLNLQNQAMKLASGTNCLVPLDDYSEGPNDILDICCGTGQWIIEMANEFPNANLVGVDIALPKLPEPCPSNCRFMIADIQVPLPFAASSFDIVQMRTVPSIPDRKFILQEISRVLRKDGYVTFVEPGESFSGTAKPRPALVEMERLMCLSPHIPAPQEDEPAEKAAAKSWSLAPSIADMLKEASDSEGNALFTGVGSKSFNLAIGGWPKGALEAEIGRMMAEVQIGVIDGFKPVLLENDLVTSDAFETLRQDVIKELNDDSLENQTFFVYAWARKV